ncbi:hypothetical protein ACFLRY_05735 [Bacteroidota bacterium]
MFVKKYQNFQRFVPKCLPNTGRKPMTEDQFDEFISKVFTNNDLDLNGKLYCRDGFAFVKEISKQVYQITAFQINSFGAGAFGDKVKKLITPIMITVRTNSSHFYSGRTLKDTNITFEDFYLGKQYCGSKGELCDRDKLSDLTKDLFLNNQESNSYRHDIIYKLINTNFICHHIAEVLSYALGALDLYWYTKKSKVFLVSGSHYLEKQKKLKIDILDNFSFERMKGHFDIPYYEQIGPKVDKFKEHYGLMEWDVHYKRERETFFLPVGYQKVMKKKFNKAANVITTQHIVEYILDTYYKRMNTHVVTNTFQTLEYLSRAVLGLKDGRIEDGVLFLKRASSCMGHYPDRSFEDVREKQQQKFPMFISDYIHSMFFRPPVL